MITPEFRLSQTDSHLKIIIRVPYVKIQKSQFYIEENEFRFFLHPYSLFLKFEEKLKIVEYPDSCQYDYQTYELHVLVKKQNQGEIFSNLDMLSLLLVSNSKSKKQPKSQKKPLIEVLNSTTNNNNNENEEEEKSTEIKNLTNFQLIQEFKYGFNFEFSDFYQDLEDELYELHQINPAQVKISDRKLLRDNILRSQFDDEHYLYDLYSNSEELTSVMSFPFPKLYEKFLLPEYNEQQTQQLIKLAKKEILIENNYENFGISSLIDLMFSFCYEWKVMGGDELTPESAITINKCSSLLSCHTVDENLKEVISQNFSRVLTYPLIRHFELAKKVLEEIKNLIQENGKIFILKVLLEIKKLFSSCEPRYLLNHLYIDSLCLFTQQIKEETLLNLKEKLQQIKINKKDLILQLDAIENLAVEQLNEQISNL